MAVTDTNAITFCNTRIRPLADRLAQAYWIAKEIAAEGVAKGITAGATPAIPNDSTAISDNATLDGRTPIIGTDVYNVQALATTLITAMEASASLKLTQVLKVAVNANP